MTTFSYPIIIYYTTPKRTFQALTNRADLDIYLDGTGPQSTWTAGEPVYWAAQPGDDAEDYGQRVVEVKKPHALSYTWFKLSDIDDDADPAGDEEETVARFEISETDFPNAVWVTVTHSGFASEESPLYQRMRDSWVTILSSLKTYLESDDAAPADED